MYVGMQLPDLPREVQGRIWHARRCEDAASRIQKAWRQAQAHFTRVTYAALRGLSQMARRNVETMIADIFVYRPRSGSLLPARAYVMDDPFETDDYGELDHILIDLLASSDRLEGFDINMPPRDKESPVLIASLIADPHTATMCLYDARGPSWRLIESQAYTRRWSATGRVRLRRRGLTARTREPRPAPQI